MIPPADSTITLPLPRQAPTRQPAAPAVQGPVGSLPVEQVSALLWAGLGLGRHGSGGRAFIGDRQLPAAVYALLAEGAYRYDARAHQLVLLTPRDIRTVGRAPRAAPAALELVYVEDQRCVQDPTSEECGVLSGTGVAAIADNVAAYCDAVGLLATDQQHADPRLASALRLAPGERIAFVQAVRSAAPAAH